MYYDDYLIHFGVKGMKWGVRKSEYKSADRATRKSIRDEYKKNESTKDKLKRYGKNAAVGVGIAAVVGAAGFGGLTLANSLYAQKTGMNLIRTHVKTNQISINDKIVQKSRDYIKNLYSNPIGPQYQSKTAYGPYLDPTTAGMRKLEKTIKRGFDTASPIQKLLNNSTYNKAADLINQGYSNPVFGFNTIEYDPRTKRIKNIR